MLGIDERTVLEKVRETKATLEKENQISARRNERLQLAAGSERSRKAKSLNKGVENRLERQVVAMMLQYPEILPEVDASRVLDHFLDSTLQFIGKLVLSHPPGTKEGVSNLMSMVDDTEKRNILASLSIKEEMWNIRDCRKIISKLIGHSPKRQEIFLKEQIRAAERDNNQDLALKLLDELQKSTVLNRKQMREVLREH